MAKKNDRKEYNKLKKKKADNKKTAGTVPVIDRCA